MGEILDMTWSHYRSDAHLPPHSYFDLDLPLDEPLFSTHKYNEDLHGLGLFDDVVETQDLTGNQATNGFDFTYTQSNPQTQLNEVYKNHHDPDNVTRPHTGYDCGPLSHGNTSAGPSHAINVPSVNDVDHHGASQMDDPFASNIDCEFDMLFPLHTIEWFNDASTPLTADSRYSNLPSNTQCDSTSEATKGMRDAAATPESSQVAVETPKRNSQSPRSPSRRRLKLHTCPECDRAFTYPKDLRRHKLDKHTFERPYKCPRQHCDYHIRGFKRQDACVRHVRTCHSID